MINPVLIQGIGLAALLIAISIFQTNKRKTMLILGMTACLLWSAHFFLLGAATGAAMNLSGAVRSYVYYRVRPTARNRWVLWLFIGIVFVLTAITWQGMISLLPLAASVLNLVAYWQTKTKTIRRLAFMSSPPWLVYDAAAGSYPGVAVEILLMTSNLIGQYRFDFRQTSKGKQLRFAFLSRQ